MVDYHRPLAAQTQWIGALRGAGWSTTTAICLLSLELTGIDIHSD